MEDPTEQLISRSLGRRPPPRLGPTFGEDVLRRVAIAERAAREPEWARARRRLAPAIWLLAAAASVAVLAKVEWSSASWALALVAVPLAYSATLWPDSFLVLLALCGGPLAGDPRDKPPRARTS